MLHDAAALHELLMLHLFRRTDALELNMWPVIVAIDFFLFYRSMHNGSNAMPALTSTQDDHAAK